MVLGLRSFSERERTGDGGREPILDTENGEELMHVQRGVDLVLANLPPHSRGTLYITTRYDYDYDYDYEPLSLCLSVSAFTSILSQFVK